MALAVGAEVAGKFFGPFRSKPGLTSRRGGAILWGTTGRLVIDFGG